MARVVAQQWVSLDGFASGEDGEEVLFEAVDAAADRRSQEHNAVLLADVTEVLLGRRTYEQFVTYWPTADEPIAPRLNALPKTVASRSLQDAPWPGFRPATVAPDAAGHIRSAGSGVVLVWGSLGLLQSLTAQGLVDELDLFVVPVVLGSGRRLLEQPTRLRQLASEDWGAVTHLRYALT